MFWLTWRQHRMQVLVTAALLLGGGVFLLVHGLRNADMVAALPADPGERERIMGERFRPVYQVLTWLPWAPLLVGLFWGAPVVAREYERGTYRLAWTQSVTRHRWLVTKLAWLGLLAALAGLAVGMMVDAWLATFADTRFADRFGNPTVFGSTGVVSGAWWLFAFMLGAATGAVLRRLLPAMAVTVAVFTGLLFGVIGFGRDLYAEPVRIAGGFDEVPRDAMVEEYGWVSPDGTEYLTADLPVCQSAGRTEYLDCLAEERFSQAIYLHPADRYWRFQWTETALLLVVTAALAAAAGYRVTRR